jgi:hypothetical protein
VNIGAKPTAKRVHWLDDARAALDEPLAWLGLVFGIASAISFVARVFDVGLQGVFDDFVRFYRGLLAPLYGWVNIPPWPFDVPPIAVDALALYAVLFGMCVRFERQAAHFNANRDLQKMSKGRLSFDQWTRLRNRYSVKSIVLRSTVLWAIVSALPLRVNSDPLVADAQMRLAGLAQTGAEGKEWVENTLGGFRRSRVRALLGFVMLPLAVLLFFAWNAYA